MTLMVHCNNVRCSELLRVFTTLTTGKYRLKSAPEDILTYLLTYLLTYSMEQSPS